MRRRASAAPKGEFITFSPGPTNTDFPDASLTQAGKFAVLASGSWIGNRIRIPDTAPTVATLIAAYNQDTHTRLTFDGFAPAPGGFQSALFTTPVPVVPGVNYLAAWFTDRYVFNNAYVWPAQSDDGRIVTPTISPSFFLYGAALAEPDTASAGNFYISPLIVF